MLRFPDTKLPLVMLNNSSKGLLLEVCVPPKTARPLLGLFLDLQNKNSALSTRYGHVIKRAFNFRAIPRSSHGLSRVSYAKLRVAVLRSRPEGFPGRRN